MAGRGSLRERGEGKWELTVALGMDAKGKQIRKYHTVSAKNKKEAERLLAKFVTEVDSGNVGDNERMTLQDFMEIWFKDYAQTQLAPKTFHRYAQLSKRIIAALGHIKLGKLRPNHILAFYDNLKEPGIREDDKHTEPTARKGLSEQTVLHYHRLLHAMLETAVQWQYIAANPVARVKAPKVQPSEAVCYSEEQIVALLEALKKADITYQVAVSVTLAGGLRQGELMGLRWEDVDLDAGIFRVNRVRQYICSRTEGDKIVVKEPKTLKSKRCISLPPSVITLLKRYKWVQNGYKSQLANLYHDTGYLLVHEDGTPLWPEAMSHWFPKFLKANGLPHMNFHGLRHSSATLLISEGLGVADVSRILGHARTSTTLDIYTHAFQKADELAAEKLEKVLSRNKA